MTKQLELKLGSISSLFSEAGIPKLRIVDKLISSIEGNNKVYIYDPGELDISISEEAKLKGNCNICIDKSTNIISRSDMALPYILNDFSTGKCSEINKTASTINIFKQIENIMSINKNVLFIALTVAPRNFDWTNINSDSPFYSTSLHVTFCNANNLNVTCIDKNKYVLKIAQQGYINNTFEISIDEDDKPKYIK